MRAKQSQLKRERIREEFAESMDLAKATLDLIRIAKKRRNIPEHEALSFLTEHYHDSPELRRRASLFWKARGVVSLLEKKAGMKGSHPIGRDASLFSDASTVAGYLGIDLGENETSPLIDYGVIPRGVVAQSLGYQVGLYVTGKKNGMPSLPKRNGWHDFEHILKNMRKDMKKGNGKESPFLGYLVFSARPKEYRHGSFEVLENILGRKDGYSEIGSALFRGKKPGQAGEGPLYAYHFDEGINPFGLAILGYSLEDSFFSRYSARVHDILERDKMRTLDNKTIECFVKDFRTYDHGR